MAEPIREDEWLREIERLSRPKDSEGKTVAEWMTALRCSKGKVWAALKAAMALGWLVVGHRSASRIDGVPCTVPVYRIVKPKRK